MQALRSCIRLALRGYFALQNTPRKTRQRPQVLGCTLRGRISPKLLTKTNCQTRFPLIFWSFQGDEPLERGVRQWPGLW